jgi:hypothetical protein
MPAHNRNLELDTVGDDVGRLHEQLETIGFPIGADERLTKLFGPTTQDAVAFLQKAHGAALRELGWQGQPGVVEHTTAALVSRTRDRVVEQRKPPPAPAPANRVAGLVKDTTGAALVGATITVSNHNIRGSQQLAVGSTDNTGAFDIPFDFRPGQTDEARGPEQPAAPDLRFAVVDDAQHPRQVLRVALNGDGAPAEVSRVAPAPDAPFIIVNAAARTDVVLHVDDNAGETGLSEFEEVEARLRPALQGLSYGDLSDAGGRFQISFLTRETGIRRPIIERLIAAATSSRLTGSGRHPVPEAVFYGLGHASLDVDLAALSWLPRRDLTSALHVAVDENVIPLNIGPDIDRHVETILTIGGERALLEPLGDGSETPRTWLALAGLETEAQHLLVRELADHEGPDDALWERLRNDRRMGGADTVRRAELVLRLASFTGNNLPLVRLLVDPHHVDARSLADLAKLDEPVWLSLLARAGVPEADRQEGESAGDAGKRHARMLMRIAQQTYPTAAVEGIAKRLHRELSLDPDVSTWLAAAEREAQSDMVPAIDLRSTHIDRYFADHEARIGFQPANTDRVRADLKRIQRTLAIAQEPRQIVPLLREGHDSALRVANTPASLFVEVHGATLGLETAQAIHARARQVHFAHLFIHSMVFDGLNDRGLRI